MERPFSKTVSVRTAICLMLVGGILFTVGCSKKPAAQTAPPATAASAATDAPTDMNVVLGQLTQDLRKYSFEHRHVPASFSEWVTAGNLGTIPAAPAGKKFAIDAKAMQVVLVKQ